MILRPNNTQDRSGGSRSDGAIFFAMRPGVSVDDRSGGSRSDGTIFFAGNLKRQATAMATTAGTAVSAAAANVAAAAAAGGGKTAAAAKATAQATVQATAVVASKTAVQLKSAASKYVGRRPEDVSDEEVVEHYFFYSADRPKQALRALLLRRHTLLSVFYPSFHDPMKVSSSRHSLPRPRNIHSPQHTDDAHSRKDLPPPAGTLFLHQRFLHRGHRGPIRAPPAAHAGPRLSRAFGSRGVRGGGGNEPAAGGRAGAIVPTAAARRHRR
jgi:hypothetical protein